MKIHVRRRHIEKGKRHSTERCPVALAVREAGGKHPLVSYRTVTSSLGGFVLPRIARGFIFAFDSGKPVKPFAFVLK